MSLLIMTRVGVPGVLDIISRKPRKWGTIDRGTALEGGVGFALGLIKALLLQVDLATAKAPMRPSMQAPVAGAGLGTRFLLREHIDLDRTRQDSHDLAA